MFDQRSVPTENVVFHPIKWFEMLSRVSAYSKYGLFNVVQ